MGLAVGSVLPFQNRRGSVWGHILVWSNNLVRISAGLLSDGSGAQAGSYLKKSVRFDVALMEYVHGNIATTAMSPASDLSPNNWSQPKTGSPLKGKLVTSLQDTSLSIEPKCNQ